MCLNEMALMEGFMVANCPEATISDTAATRTGSIAFCTGDTTCVCPIETRPMSGSESGTYTTSGNMLNLMPTSGTPNSIGYCVQGDEVHLLNVETITDMGVSKMRTRSDQVAQRQ